MGLSPPTQRTSRVLGRTDKTRPPQERGAHTRNDRRLSDSRTGQTDLAGAREGRIKRLGRRICVSISLGVFGDTRLLS